MLFLFSMPLLNILGVEKHLKVHPCTRREGLQSYNFTSFERIFKIFCLAQIVVFVINLLCYMSSYISLCVSSFVVFAGFYELNSTSI